TIPWRKSFFTTCWTSTSPRRRSGANWIRRSIGDAMLKSLTTILRQGDCCGPTAERNRKALQSETRPRQRRSLSEGRTMVVAAFAHLVLCHRSVDLRCRLGAVLWPDYCGPHLARSGHTPN